MRHHFGLIGDVAQLHPGRKIGGDLGDPRVEPVGEAQDVGTGAHRDAEHHGRLAIVERGELGRIGRAASDAAERAQRQAGAVGQRDGNGTERGLVGQIAARFDREQAASGVDRPCRGDDVAFGELRGETVIGEARRGEALRRELDEHPLGPHPVERDALHPLDRLQPVARGLGPVLELAGAVALAGERQAAHRDAGELVVDHVVAGALGQPGAGFGELGAQLLPDRGHARRRGAVVQRHRGDQRAGAHCRLDRLDVGDLAQLVFDGTRNELLHPRAAGAGQIGLDGCHPHLDEGFFGGGKIEHGDQPCEEQGDGGGKGEAAALERRGGDRHGDGP